MADVTDEDIATVQYAVIPQNSFSTVPDSGPGVTASQCDTVVDCLAMDQSQGAAQPSEHRPSSIGNGLYAHGRGRGVYIGGIWGEIGERAP